MISQIEEPLSLSEYVTYSQDNVYNDESYYTSIRLSLLVKLGNAETDIEIETTQQFAELEKNTTYSMAESYEAIAWEIEKLNLSAIEDALRKRLIQEISFIVCYAITRFEVYI